MKITLEKSKIGENPVADLFAAPMSIQEEVEFKKLMIVEELLALMKDQGINRSQLAKKMGVQPSRITAMMTGTNNFTIETLVRAGRAVGAELHQHFAFAGAKTQWSTYRSEEVHEAFRVEVIPMVLNPVKFTMGSDAKEDNGLAA